MKISLRKDNFLNSIKAVKGIVNTRGVQPILGAILIQTEGTNKIKLTTTDLNLAISYTTEAEVINEGKFAIQAKVIEDIVTKLPDGKNITLELDEETKLIKIQSDKTKYDVVSLNSEEFPNIFEDKKKDEQIEAKEFEISSKDLNKSIKQTAFASVPNEVGGVLGGICFTINENTLEVVATDGNRLARSRVPINSKSETLSFIIPSRAVVEVSKLISMVQDKTLNFIIKGTKILFKFENILFQSGLIDGIFPKYQQLIPTTNEKIALIDREKLLNTIDRVSVMVNNRTNIMKFNFTNSAVEISTDTPEAGSAKDLIDIDYSADDLLIAFNYKYVLDALRNIQNPKIRLEMSTNLSAALILPENTEDTEEDNYLCLIMPVQVR